MKNSHVLSVFFVLCALHEGSSLYAVQYAQKLGKKILTNKVLVGTTILNGATLGWEWKKLHPEQREMVRELPGRILGEMSKKSPFFDSHFEESNDMEMPSAQNLKKNLLRPVVDFLQRAAVYLNHCNALDMNDIGIIPYQNFIKDLQQNSKKDLPRPVAANFLQRAAVYFAHYNASDINDTGIIPSPNSNEDLPRPVVDFLQRIAVYSAHQNASDMNDIGILPPQNPSEWRHLSSVATNFLREQAEVYKDKAYSAYHNASNMND